MEDLTRNKVVSFTYKEFKELLEKITYGTIDIEYESNEWFFIQAVIDDELELNEWKLMLEEKKVSFKEVQAELGEMMDEDGFILPDGKTFAYRMIGKKLNAIVKEVVVDVSSDIVVVIFE